MGNSDRAYCINLTNLLIENLLQYMDEEDTDKLHDAIAGCIVGFDEIRKRVKWKFC